MTDPKNPKQEDDNFLEGLEEIPPAGDAQAEELPDLSALFDEEPAPLPQKNAEQPPVISTEAGGISLSQDSSSSDSSGSFHLLDESALNNAADLADSSDVSGAMSDPDISDILESMGDVPGEGTTATRAAAGMLTSSSQDSSGDLDLLPPSNDSDSGSGGDAIGITPTTIEEQEPAVAPKKTKKISKNEPATASAPRGGRGGILAGSVMGLVGGLAASQALWLFGLELPHTLRQADPAHVTELKSLVQQGKEAGAKASALEDDLATAKQAADDAAGKAKAEIQKHLTDKATLAGKLAEQAETHASVLKSEQSKADKALKDTMAAASKEMEDLKSTTKAAMAKMEKDHDSTKADSKSNLEKAVAETAKEKSRATDLETKLATEAKGWGVLAGKLKSAGLGDPKAESGSIVPLVEKAVSLAMIKDPAGEIRKLSLQMADEKSRLEKDVASKSAQLQAQADELARRRPPAESLEFWRPLLQADLPDSKLTLEAVKDAQRVLAKATADSPDAAKAKVIEALSEAAQGKLAEAKKRITGLANLPPGPWADAAKSLEARLASPSSVALAKARELVDNGKAPQAIELLTKANTSPLPDDPALPRLRAELALLLVVNDKPDLTKAESLANESAKAREALAFYVQGRVLEAKGNSDAAGALFSRAIEAAKADDPMLIQYRLARIRRLKAMGGPALSPTLRQDDTLALSAWLLVATTMVDAETLVVPDPREMARKREIRALLNDPKAPALLKAQVLLEDDQPLQALAKLQEHLAQRGASEPETIRLLASITKALESKGAGSDALVLAPQARRDEANRLYGKGKQLVLAGKGEQAEETLNLAAKYAGKDIDARFIYFLGLAQWGQGDKASAERSFLRALELERRNLPSPREVSRSLEEIQGPVRDAIDAIRYGSVLAPGSFR